MHAQVCTRPDIAYVIGMLGSYLNNLGVYHWKVAKIDLVVLTENKILHAHILEVKSA